MQIDEKTFVVNSPVSVLAFVNFVQQLYSEKKYITFTWRIGADRSLDQNALLHVWLTEYAAHLAGLTKKQVTKGMVEFLKRRAKKDFYAETGHAWVIDRLTNPETGEQGAAFFASSSDYKQGEMFLFLSWLQMKAANDGLVLESRGEYAKLQREQAA